MSEQYLSQFILLAGICVSLFIPVLLFLKFYESPRQGLALVCLNRKSIVKDPSGEEIAIPYTVAIDSGLIVIPVMHRPIWVDIAPAMATATPTMRSRDSFEVEIEASVVFRVKVSDRVSVRVAADSTLEKKKIYLEKMINDYIRRIVATLTVLEIKAQKKLMREELTNIAKSAFQKLGVEIIEVALVEPRVLGDAGNPLEADMSQAREKALQDTAQAAAHTRQLKIRLEEEANKQRAAAREGALLSETKLQRAEIAAKVLIFEAEREEKKAEAERDAMTRRTAAEEEGKVLPLEHKNTGILQDITEIKAATARRQTVEAAVGAEARFQALAAHGGQGYKLEVLEELHQLLENALGPEGLTGICRAMGEPLGNVNNLNILDFTGASSGEADAAINGGGGIARLAGVAPEGLAKLMAIAKAQGLNAETLLKVASSLGFGSENNQEHGSLLEPGAVPGGNTLLNGTERTEPAAGNEEEKNNKSPSLAAGNDEEKNNKSPSPAAGNEEEKNNKSPSLAAGNDEEKNNKSPSPAAGNDEPGPTTGSDTATARARALGPVLHPFFRSVARPVKKGPDE